MFFKRLLSTEPVLCASFLAAAASACFVHPSVQYFTYPDYGVLGILFCLMAVVAGLQESGVFLAVVRRLVHRVRQACLLDGLLVGSSFLTAMLVTNDVALLMLVPLASLLLLQHPDRLIFVVVLQTAAANLGSMATPMGNPQNLYLYSAYKMASVDFFAAVLPTAGVSLLLLVLLWLAGERSLPNDVPEAAVQGVCAVQEGRGALFFALFVLSVLSVLRILPVWLAFSIVCATLCLTDRRIFFRVDYSLLLTFVCFFVFVGNVRRIDAVQTVFGALVQGRELLAGVLLSQVISNVPAAMVLSPFTGDGHALLLGVNIGGLGTPVASLASLISMRLYAKLPDARTGRYLAAFSVVNMLLLGSLYIFAVLK